MGRRMCRQEGTQEQAAAGQGRQERAVMGAAAPVTYLLLEAGDGGEVGVGEAAGGLRLTPGLRLPREVVDLPLVVPPSQGQPLQPPPWGVGSRGAGVPAARARGAGAAQGRVSPPPTPRSLPKDVTELLLPPLRCCRALTGVQGTCHGVRERS